MNAHELYKAGKLADAIAAQTQEVKTNPADHARRLFLFELHCFAGDLERAIRQIDPIQYNDMELDAAVTGYRRLIDAEAKRRKVFQGTEAPKFLADPSEAVKKRVQAVAALRADQAQAKKLLAEADATPPALRGTLNGKPFEHLRDCDDVFGPVLEVMAHGEYFWAPLEQIDTLAMNAPAVPRDLIWLPAVLSLRDGPTGNVFLPALYPGSHEYPNDQVKLGRLTEWQTPAGGPVLGAGGRLFLVNDDAVPLLEWRQLELTA